MAFYGELFRKKDEEDIWEELRQMLLNPPSEQEIALKKQEDQDWIDSILNKAFPENPNPQTEQSLRTNNNSMLPMGTLNQFSLEGFGQSSINGFANKKKQNEFPDLGKTTDYKNVSFAPVYDDEEKEMLKNYLVDPNQNIVMDEMGDFLSKKKPKYEIEEPVNYEEMSDEDEDTTSEELETSEETEKGNSEEKTEETSSEHQKEPYLRYEDLLPDETDEEREAREARELEAFNKAWDKANGVKEKVFTKPSQETLKATIIKDDIYTPYNDEIENNPNLTEEEKVAKKLEVLNIQKAASARKKEITREHILNQTKNIGKEVLPFLMPKILPAKLLTKASNMASPLIKKTIPNVGNAYKKELAEETAKTVLTSPISSTQEAIEEKKNIPQTILKNLPKDLAQNYLLSGGKISKNKLRIRNSIEKKVPDWNTRQQRKQTELQEDFYRDYVNKKNSYEDFLEKLRRKRRRR